jgi:hypothetical protein
MDIFRDGFNALGQTLWRELGKNPSPVFSVTDYRAKKIASRRRALKFQT